MFWAGLDITAKSLSGIISDSRMLENSSFKNELSVVI